MKNNWFNGMMGLIAGDALGMPVQFHSREEIASRPQGPVRGMEGFGTYSMPPGTWSDDSSMALCTVESITRLGTVDPEDIMDNFLKWEKGGEFTPFGEAFDEGITCSDAIFRYEKERDWHTCGKTGEHANGNGALMRILPVCLFCAEQGLPDADAVRRIHDVTMLTHNHLRAKIASGLYFFMARSILRDQEEPGSSAESLQKLLQSGIDEGAGFYRKRFRERYHDDRLLYCLSQLDHYRRLFDLDKFREEPGSGIRSSGYVVDSIEAAVWCLVTEDSLEKSLLKAVNLGEDTDTVGAIAGGLAGLYYGADGIPADWLGAIQKRDRIVSLLKEADMAADFEKAVKAAKDIDPQADHYTEYENGYHFMAGSAVNDLSDPGFAIAKKDGKVYRGLAAHEFLRGDILGEGNI